MWRFIKILALWLVVWKRKWRKKIRGFVWLWCHPFFQIFTGIFFFKDGGSRSSSWEDFGTRTVKQNFTRKSSDQFILETNWTDRNSSNQPAASFEKKNFEKKNGGPPEIGLKNPVRNSKKIWPFLRFNFPKSVQNPEKNSPRTDSIFSLRFRNSFFLGSETDFF